LVLPKRQLFEEDAEQPSASVVIGVAGRQPASDQVRALQNLVAGAVPNLKPERVTIVDQNAKLLGGGDSQSAAGAAADDQRSATEEKIKKRIKELVEGIVGPGKARVQVTADLDLNQVTTQEEKFDPDGQVVRSTQTNEESAKQNQPETTGGASASANVPGTPGAANAPNSGSASGHNEETTNYEISKTTKTTIEEPGAIKRLSVAVAVDGVTAAGADGKQGSYTPRSAQEMQRIDQLVRSAVGFDAARGDQVNVINVRFDREAAATGAAVSGSKLLDFDKNDLMRGAELLVLAAVAALIIFFVVRPLLASTGGGPAMAFAPMRALPAGPGGANGATGGQITHDGHASEALALPSPVPNEVDNRIDIARIEGQVRVSSVKSVSDFVERHPEESVSILRSWLHEA
jgi:flagellar M-ring protein FliF